jgi:putative inorganic carbon (HCO3(-)) transporter
MTTVSTSSLERYAFFALAGFLGLIQLTIQAEALFDVAVLLWLVIAWRERQRPIVPAFFLPLLVLAGFTLVSSAFSIHPGASLLRSRQLYLYLIVPVTMRVARGERATIVTNVIIAVGAVSALIGIVEYAAFGYDNLNHRPRGLLGHYMTYSGVLMLVVCAAVARLVYRGAEWIWPAVAVPALLVALVASESRNAWVGALLAIVCLLSLRTWKLLVAVPLVIALGGVLAPSEIRGRALSMFNPNDPTNRDRISMLKSGEAMIADHPLTGVGPNMVPDAYKRQYKRADAVDPANEPGATRLHLHNVPVQLAAERGLPALAAWLWFVVIALRDLWRQARRGPAPALAAAGLAAVIAMLAAGQFEHNFGDSEFLILFLGLISLPFAAALAGPTGYPADRGESGV